MAVDVSKETSEPLSGGGGGWISAVFGTPGFKIDVGGVSCLLTGTVFGAAG